MFYQPKQKPFSIDPYKSLIFPRPIGWISSIDIKGIVNLAPYSYFNAIVDEPPQIMFVAGVSDKPLYKKDTLSNIMATKEFVVNFGTTATRKQMNLSSKDVHKDVDEFILTKLKKRKSKLVKVPSVADSPVNLECKLIKTIKLKSNSRKFSTMIIGEVIGIYIKDSFIEKGRVNSAAMRYVARMGYSEYTTISSKFKMKRPK
ncbi:flavin reductase family protein [bacterium]|nr:flavin reductase family protein [bacterium]